MSFTKLNTIRQQSQQKNFDSIYFVYGEEEYIHHEIAQIMQATVVDRSVVDLNTDILYGDEVNGATVLSACLALPMMSERRLVVVHSFDSLTFSDADRFVSYIEKPEIQTVAVFLANKINKTKKIHKSLLQHAHCIEAKKISSDAELFQWIKTEFLHRKKEIKPEAIRLLADHTGNNLYELISHIEKIVTYTMDVDLVDDTHIEDIVGVSKEFNVYELQDAIIRRDKEKSLSILKRLIEQGEDPIYLNSLIFYRFVKQWLVIQMVKEKRAQHEAAKILSLPPYIAGKYLASSNYFTMQQCNSALKYLKETDMKLKSSGTDANQLLTFNIINILQK